VCLSRANLLGLDPADGKILWKLGLEADPKGEDSVSTPVISGNGIVCTTFGPSSSSRSRLMCVVVDNGKPVKVWTSKDVSRNRCQSPVIWEDCVYLTGDVAPPQALQDRKGQLICYDLRTGGVLWRSTAPQNTGGPPGKPTNDGGGVFTIAGGKALLLNGDGQVVMAEVSSKGCAVLGAVDFAADTAVPHPLPLAYHNLTSPILLQGRIYVRNHEKLACYDTTRSAPASRPSTTQASEPATRPAARTPDLILDLGNNVTLKCALIPAGSFIMGSPSYEKDRVSNEGPQHEVKIDKPFYLGMYEVTVDQYKQFVRATGHEPAELGIGQRGDHPVTNVTWEDAQAFCAWLAKKSGRGVRLPTEAQWEYACRAGTDTRFSFGQNDEEFCQYGNYCDQSSTANLAWQDNDHNDGYDKTAPVGSYKPNPWGLYDMHGNVREWCGDVYAESVAGTDTGPAAEDSGKLRVQRGGSWRDMASVCRSASRNGLPREYRFANNGFRTIILTAVQD
jgi:formylglycine-generating enzyme required for sulfatase activity